MDQTAQLPKRQHLVFRRNIQAVEYLDELDMAIQKRQVVVVGTIVPVHFAGTYRIPVIKAQT